MAFADPALETAHDPRLGVPGRDAGTRLLSVDAATPSICFSACRTGLISDLLLQCGAGDVAAFEAIMNIFYSVVRAATTLELPEEEVDHVVHGTFVAIWRASPGYRPGGATPVEWIMGHAAGAASDCRERAASALPVPNGGGRRRPIPARLRSPRT